MLVRGKHVLETKISVGVCPRAVEETIENLEAEDQPYFRNYCISSFYQARKILRVAVG